MWRAGSYNLRFLGAIGLLFVIAAPWIVRLFTSDPAVIRSGVACLRIVSAGFPFYAYGMVLTNSFNGAGDTWTPTWINLFCFWLWEIPLAWILSEPLGLGPPRRVRRHGGGVLHPRRGERHPVPAGALEVAAGVVIGVTARIRRPGHRT